MTADPSTITEQHMIDAIRAAGLRVTLPRRAICRVLAESNEGFLSATTIAEKVAATAGGIDSSTVYRTLNELGRLGFVHYLPIGNQSWAWHPTVDCDHHHLICEACGRSHSVPVEELAPAFDRIHSKYGFRPATHHFAIIGLCDSCQAASRAGESPSATSRNSK